MNRTGVALACALLVTSACARVQPQPLRLPPRDAPIERRVVAYRQHAAMPHVGMSGWAMRLGNGPVGDLSDDRPYLANAREAEEVLHARDNQLALGWGFMGAGMATVLISLAVTVISVLSIDTDRFATDPQPTSLIPMMFTMGGTLIMLPGTFIIADAQRRVPSAVEAYNRWLWRELALPQDAPDRPASPR